MAIQTLMLGSREGDGGQGVWTLLPLGKIEVAIGFLRNTGMDPPREAIGPTHLGVSHNTKG